jgi:hypothetical protein
MMNSLLAQTVISYLLIFAVPMVLPVLFLKVVGLSGLRPGACAPPPTWPASPGPISQRARRGHRRGRTATRPG